MWEGEKFMEKQWEKCFNWKKIIVCPVSAGIVFFCIFGLYKINSLIPAGILVYDIPEEEIRGRYRDLYAEVSGYDTKEMGERQALLLTPKKDMGQILVFTLREHYNDAYVRDLKAERGIRLALIGVFAYAALFICINPIIFLIMGEKGKKYRYILRIAEFFLLCFFVSKNGILPSACVPKKFVYFREWWGKCVEYFGAIKKMGDIPCPGYQEYAGFKGLLAGLFVVALTVILFCGNLGLKEKYKKIKKLEGE